MKDIRQTYPIDLVDFAIQKGIAEEPAFAWWIPFVIKKRNRIIAKIKFEYLTRTHKFGIIIPRSVEEIIKLDHFNKDTLWWSCI